MERDNLEIKIENPLGSERVNSLLFKFALPSVIALLVSALYNIVDQIFIGQGVGVLGNAATNVAFPLNTICVAIALLIGLGGASNFSMELGRERTEEAKATVGTMLIMLGVFGITYAATVMFSAESITVFFGANQEVFQYAVDYIEVIAIGFPFLIFSTAFSSIIRADGSPTYSMICMLVGAVLNTILDPIFIFVFHMGVKGAAIATVISQIVSAIICFIYIKRMKTVKIEKNHIEFKSNYARKIVSLGAAGCFNQLAMTVVQVVLNNSLSYYGALSTYGSAIPLAVAGIVTKTNMIFMSVVIGIAQGMQPISGFNYGAGKYHRVKETYKKAVSVATIAAIIAFLVFQLFTSNIISLFGEGSSEYFIFADRFFRIYLMVTFLNGVQPVTSNFFTSIGKAIKGIFVSMTRQIIFLLPLIVFFPMIMGIDGIMYAGPVADTMSFIVAMILVIREIKSFPKTTQKTTVE